MVRNSCILYPLPLDVPFFPSKALTYPHYAHSGVVLESSFLARFEFRRYKNQAPPPNYLTGKPDDDCRGPIRQVGSFFHG